MPQLDLTTHTRITSSLVDLILKSRAEGDHRAFVVTPHDPLPQRRLHYPDPQTVVWQQDLPDFDKVKRVENWGWLRRNVAGFSTDFIVHPAIGTAFHVKGWRYQPNTAPGNRRRTGGPIPIERFSGPILIARLTDGRFFADQWADPSVLWDSLDRWRNVRGYLVDWDARLGYATNPTCAIRGADWKTIPDTFNVKKRTAA